MLFSSNVNSNGKIVIVGIAYAIYGIIHLFLFNTVKTTISYSNVIHEAQYIVNYSFLILNLFVYSYVFKEGNTDKLKKSILISIGIYIVSIYIAIITGTSSSTYIEKMGYKGWYESGNSLSAIFTLGLFVILPMIKQIKKRILIPLLIAIGAFLCFLIGTRVRTFWIYIGARCICSM
ncbi:MAG: O-antigen ligase family protein [Clostridia bacterium]|nr:O-antigen ligase family protein [Clostridia bacterium]